MELILIWLAFAVLCAILAPSRGRSAIAWFFLGLVFGVFALIALLALPRLGPAPGAAGGAGPGGAGSGRT